MSAFDESVHLVFGVGFKVGIFFVIIASISLLSPWADYYLNSAFTQTGFLVMFNMTPLWVKALSFTLTLMGFAFLISFLQGWVEPMVELIFYEDNLTLQRAELEVAREKAMDRFRQGEMDEETFKSINMDFQKRIVEIDAKLSLSKEKMTK